MNLIYRHIECTDEYLHCNFGIDNLGVKPIVDRNVMQKLTKHIKWHNQAATNVLFIDKNRQNVNQ